MSFDLNYKYKALVLIIFINLVAVVTSVFFTSFDQVIIVSIVAVLLTYMTRSVWLPPNHGQNKVRLYSLYIALIVFTASKYNSISPYFYNLLKEFIPESSKLSVIFSFEPNAVSYPVLIFLSITIYVANKSLTSTNSMGEKLSSFDKEIPEPDFPERLKNALVALEDDIKSINKQSNWTGSFYTDLDAEVYVKTKTKNKKKVSSLLKALNSNSGRAFLVLGEPGGGKSVALRKLAMELIPQVKEANKIPLYINLKEWSDTNWSDSNPPTEKKLLEFIKENVSRRDLALNIFVDKYFDRLVEKKRFFFIFDSFDEIPQVMNVDDNSLLIQKLSSVLYQFIKDNNNKPTGLVASRHFRKPTRDFDASSEIEIRPFSGAQISKSLRKMSNSPEVLVNRIFTVRSDLYLTAKNPFMASMISKYIEIHSDLPKNRLEMFSVFIDDALDNSSRKLDDLSLDKEYILASSKKIAVSMFSDFGLEASVNDLKAKFPDILIDEIIECLKFARLIRASSSDSGRVSFVHRRFCEYFVVLDMLDRNRDIPFQEIPKDSQWRDALVLFCEVSDVSKATEIADKCWSIIKTDDGKGSLEAIHCIRFLRDAFKGRHDCVEHFQEEVQDFIDKELGENKPVYWTKFVIELLCLCRTDMIESSVIRALKMKNTWLCTTAVESCRHLSTISKALKIELGRYLNGRDDLQFVKNLQGDLFNFGISDAFLSVKRYLVFRMVEIIFSIGLYIAFFIYEPILTMAITLVMVIQSFLVYVMSSVLPVFRYFIKSIGGEKSVINLELLFKGIVQDKILENDNTFVGLLFTFYDVIKKSTFWLVLISPVVFLFIYLLGYSEFAIDKIDKISLDTVQWTLFYLTLVLAFFSSLKLLVTTGIRMIEKETVFLVIMNLIAVLVMVFLINKYIEVIEVFIRWVSYLMASLFSVMALFKIRTQLQARKKYKKIDVSKLTSREAIYAALTELDGNKLYSSKIIDRIELTIPHVIGEWPDKKFLCSNHSSNASRLSQLDVRWLGID